MESFLELIKTIGLICLAVGFSTILIIVQKKNSDKINQELEEIKKEYYSTNLAKAE